MIDRWPDWPDRIVALVGPEGSGKSHLAAVWAEAAGARILAAKLLSDVYPPASLATGALVVEDLAPGAFDERALFHLLNLAREHEAYLMLTARTPPAGWGFAIRDVGSRLKALPVVIIAPPGAFNRAWTSAMSAQFR